MEITADNIKLVLALLSGVVLPLVFTYVKDQLAKNNLQNKDQITDITITNLESKFNERLEMLSNKIKSQDDLNRLQEASITAMKEGAVITRERIQQLRQSFEEFQSYQREEIKDVKITLDKTTKAIIQLEVTLKGLANVIEQFKK